MKTYLNSQLLTKFSIAHRFSVKIKLNIGG